MRVKKNIKPISNVLSKILKLRGVSFEWKFVDTDVEKSSPHHFTEIGFIAQEVAHVFPELVFKRDKENAKYMVKYADVIALCIEGIKEQSLLLDDKEARLEKLEMKVK